MTKRIFRVVLFTALLTMFACLVFIIGIQYQFYGEAQTESLKSEAYLISSSLEDGALIESFSGCKERITLIEANGQVIFDNRADISKMENHISRPEIKEAMEKGDSSKERYSQTISKHSVYYAVTLSDGKILRIAGERDSVFTVLLQLLPAISAIILLTTVIALTLAAVMSKKILKPINSIDPENPHIEESYEELSPLIKKLRYQKRKIDKQISELTQGRKEFEIISENMSEGMLLTDKNGVILTVNKSIKRHFNINEDIIGKNLLSVRRSEVFRNVFESILDARHFEQQLNENGRCYDIIVNPVIDEVGEACGAVVLVIDVTEKQEREKLRREFTANVSHELKTPLTSILGFSDMIKEGIVATEDIKGFGADINRETKRLITLVNDIIKLSRLDEGVIDSDIKKVNLKTVALDVKERLLPIAQNNDITFNIAGEDAVIDANESLIFEMLYNLCDNAVKYNKNGGSITVTSGGMPEGVFVSVKDTGIGIPPEDTERIFERFYRVDKSRSNSGGGTGLGLSIVKHIASVTGGVISVESTPDVGTEITITY